jgi:transcriptional regulator with XRE-family HTH domain
MKAAMQFFQEELGLSHRQLADLLHTNRSTITRYMNGMRNLPPAAETQLVWLYAVALQAPLPATDLLLQAEPATIPAADTLQLALQQREKLHRQMEDVLVQMQQAAKLEQWLTVMGAHTHLLSMARQQRCMEELQYHQRSRQHSCRQQYAQLQQQLHRANDEIALLQQRMQVAETTLAETPVLKERLPALGQNGT